MTHTGYLVGGYGVTFAVLAGYAAWVVARGRALAREVAAKPEARDQQWQAAG